MRGVGRGEGEGEQGERRRAVRGLPGELGDGVGREVWKREPAGHGLALSRGVLPTLASTRHAGVSWGGTTGLRPWLVPHMDRVEGRQRENVEQVPG